MLKLRLLDEQAKLEFSTDDTLRRGPLAASPVFFYLHQLESTSCSCLAGAQVYCVNFLSEKRLKALSIIASIQVCGYLIRNTASEAPR